MWDFISDGLPTPLKLANVNIYIVFNGLEKTFQGHPSDVFENRLIGTVAFAGNLFFHLFVCHRTPFLGIVTHQKCGSNGFITVRNVVAAR